MPPGPTGSHQSLQPSPYHSPPLGHPGDQGLVASWVSPSLTAGSSGSPIPTWGGWGTPSSLHHPTRVGLDRNQPVLGGLWALHRSRLTWWTPPTPQSSHPHPGDTCSPRDLSPPSTCPPRVFRARVPLSSPGAGPGAKGRVRDEQLLCPLLKGALCTLGPPVPSTTRHRRHGHRAGAHSACTSQPAPHQPPPPFQLLPAPTLLLHPQPQTVTTPPKNPQETA